MAAGAAGPAVIAAKQKPQWRSARGLLMPVHRKQNYSQAGKFANRAFSGQHYSLRKMLPGA